MDAFINGREVKWYELEISGEERVQIALNKDFQKLLSYIHLQCQHQFAESDIILVNGCFAGSLEKRHNIIPGISKTSKKCPGKVSVCVTMPYENDSTTVSVFHYTFQLRVVVIEMFLLIFR